MKVFRSSVSVLLSLLMIVSLFTIIPFEAFAAESIEYISRSWDAENEKVVSSTKTCSNYTTITSQNSLTIGNGQWYVVNGDATIEKRVTVNGTANIILLSGTLSCMYGIRLSKGNKLFVYPGKNSSGKLNPRTGSDEEANLGGNEGEDCGEFEFHGGTLEAHNNDWCSGGTAIGGGGYGGKCGKLSFYGGTVDATNNGSAPGKKSYGAVIGDGNDANSKDSDCFINIYGGNITADNHVDSNGSGIGGGEDSKGCPVNIYGGKITAKAYNGAGIGSGQDGGSSTVTIKNAVIDSQSDYGAGVGSGEDSDSDSVVIENSYVKSASKTGSEGMVGAEGAGIGGGNCGKSKYIKIDKSVIIASSGRYGAGIGGGDESDGGTIEITNSDVFAHSAQGGAGIGGGDEQGCDSISIKKSFVVAFTDSELNTSSEKFIKNYGDYYNTIMNSISNPAVPAEAGFYAAGSLTAMVIAYLIQGTHTGAGIGSGDSGKVNKLLIEDSVVATQAGECAAGIGGSDEGSFGTIDIKDSYIYSDGGDYGAGIGTGDEADDCGTINITNSKIEARGGKEAAGIGTGNEVGGKPTIKIDKSTVNAHGGNYAAGIGGGDNGDVKKITINNSDVKSYGGEDAAGIGGGEGGYGGSTYVTDSDVYAEGKGYGAGIGGGEDEGVGYIYVRGSSKVEAVAGGDGNSVAFGHGDYNSVAAWFTGYYPSNGTLDIDDNLHKALAGSSKNSTSLYTKNNAGSIVHACHNNKYAKLFACEHETSEMRPLDHAYHAHRCTYCGKTTDEEERHIWGSDNKCTVCGCSAEMVTMTFVEENNDGKVTRTVTRPKDSLYEMPEPENAPDGLNLYYWDENSNYRNVKQAGEEVEFTETTYTAVYIPVVDTTYIDKDGIQQSVKARRLPKKDCDLLSGWYIVDYDYPYVEDSDWVNYKLYGDVNLIIADGVTWSNKYTHFISFSGDETEFNLYGQKEQSGTIDILDGYGTFGDFYNFNQYGGIIKASTVKAKNNLTVVGGNIEVNDLEAGNQIELGWTRWNDSIKAQKYYSDKVLITEGRRFRTDENWTLESGELTEKVLNTKVLGKTLTPETTLDYYRTPEWNWSDDGTSAEALFRCHNDSKYNATVKAKISYSYDGVYRISTASVRFRRNEYTDSMQVQTKWYVYKGSHSHGDMEFNNAIAARDDIVEVAAKPDYGYAVKSITAVPSDDTVELEVRNKKFKMPECDVTVNVEFIPITPFKEPYIDQDGEYHLGNIAYYEDEDGVKYAVDEDGTIGDEVDSVELSYFNFEDLPYSRLAITSYTGPTDNLDKIEIPKTYQGKRIDQLGDGTNKFFNSDCPFELVLNENTLKIKAHTFENMNVTKVSGETESLSEIEEYAFKNANASDDNKLDFTLKYPYSAFVNTYAFEGVNLTLRINHSIAYGSGCKPAQSAKSITYVMLDEHTFEKPTWEWSDDTHTSAKATFHCTGELCGTTDTVETTDITLAEEYFDEYVYTASVQYEGETYTGELKAAKKTRDITKVIEGEGYITVQSNGSVVDTKAYVGNQTHLSLSPKKNYRLGGVTVTDSDNKKIALDGERNFIMPDKDITIKAVFVSADYNRVDRVEPYIDENGEYILGTKEYYEYNGKKYAVNEDGSVGDEISDSDLPLSYFDFKLITNDTEYQINYYTGPTENLTELVIPKTYNGKKITALGTSDRNALINYEGKIKTQFELTLNENIKEIKPYTFYTLWVTKVKGDTSNLYSIESYVFSWSNSPDDYRLDIKLDREGTVYVGSEVFNHMNVTARIKHSTTFSSTALSQQSMNYIFTDDHTYGEPAWTWDDDCKSANAKFVCTDDRCKHTEEVSAEITKSYQDGAPVYTAKAQFGGKEYTDTNALENPLDNAYSPNITAADALNLDKNLFNLPGNLVYTKAKLLGVQKKEDIKTESDEKGLRFVAEMSSEYLDADDYGFEIAKTSKTNTADFNSVNGFGIMQNLIDTDSKNIKSVSCKDTTNTITGNTAYGDNDKSSTDYKYVSLAVKNISDTQGIAVRFFVEINGVKYYSSYTDVYGNNFRGCCASYTALLSTATADEA